MKAGNRIAQLVVVAVVVLAAIVSAWLVGLDLAMAIVLAAVVVVGAGLIQRIRERRHEPATGGDVSFILSISMAALLTALAIQLVPAGRDHSNPPVTGEPQWADPQARQLMARACFGCHSNEVDWPSYSSIAPLSWAISDHVEEGRDAVNYSEFDLPQEEAEETIEVLLEGSMPPAYYTRFGLHRDANLTDQELAELVAWLRATPGLNESEAAEDRPETAGDPDDSHSEEENEEEENEREED